VKRSLLWVSLWIIALLILPLGAIAQEPTPSDVIDPTPNAGLLIHVVQRDETLSQIALQYGTSTAAIAALNGLLQPDSLQIGQRLLIPGERITSTGVVQTHVVEPGETLYTIAKRYNSTPSSLSQVNQMVNAKSLYAGQSILVTEGATGRLPLATLSAHRVQVGDSWLSLSARYGIAAAALAQANQRDPLSPLQVGELLQIPSAAGERFVQFPAPLQDFQVGPLPAEQGHSLRAYVQVAGQAQVTGLLLERPIQFVASQNGYYAYIGIHSFTEPGVYPLVLTITPLEGAPLIYETRIQVVGGNYGQETIIIPPERENLLAPDVVQAELERVAGLMSGFNGTKYFSGLMNLPSTGPITSQYGTRRSYNGSAFDSFHGGADFGGAPGSPITAPADGVVILAEALQVRGNTVIIDHGWGVYTGYWHNTELFVQAGQNVTRGDLISSLGATGLVTGAHLHWEMWVGGVQVDPLQWAIYDFDAPAK
jgi:murein DD-endopeptidase MepM/ murein hydrolase activator NlpD